MILRDQCTAVRLTAASHFERSMRGSPIGPNRAASPSTYRRLRLVCLIAILDALDKGADARDIAFGLVFPRHKPLGGATWTGSSERRHTLRLIADARRTMTGEYRRLLNHK
jgi:hypothetical protein